MDNQETDQIHHFRPGQLSQSALSELERRPTLTLGTMQRYVEALGGHLEVSAIFKDGKNENYKSDFYNKS